MINHNRPANYNRRRAAVGSAAVVAVLLAGEGIKIGANALSERIHREHTSVEVPPAGGMYKTFQLNEQFKVGDSVVTIGNLSDASKKADLPNVDSRATLEMLQSQLPKGVDSSEVTPDMTFKLPMASHIGDIHTGE